LPPCRWDKSRRAPAGSCASIPPGA
jgi:hypothetical protein